MIVPMKAPIAGKSPTKVAATDKSWFLYLIRCADGSLYTGITTDVQRRLSEHEGSANTTGRGAKFLRGKQPLSLVYKTAVADRSAALKLEYRVKQLSKAEKEALVSRRMAIGQLTTQSE